MLHPNENGKVPRYFSLTGVLQYFMVLKYDPTYPKLISNTPELLAKPLKLRPCRSVPKEVVTCWLVASRSAAHLSARRTSFVKTVTRPQKTAIWQKVLFASKVGANQITASAVIWVTLSDSVLNISLTKREKGFTTWALVAPLALLSVQEPHSGRRPPQAK